MTQLASRSIWRIYPVNLRLALVGSAICLAIGCQPTTANKLLGDWIGAPDTAAARAAREELRYGATPSATSPSSEPDNPTSVRVTDWEHYDISIRFQFVSAERLEMSLADGSQPIVAEWSIAETSPTGCVIEVVPQSEPSTEESLRRRFRLEFNESNGDLDGFVLTEVGADPELGALYFRRAQP